MLEISVQDQMKGFMEQYKETDLEQLNALDIQPLKLKVYDILDLEIPETNFGEFVKEARRLSRGIQIKSDKSGNEILTFEGNNRKILE